MADRHHQALGVIAGQRHDLAGLFGRVRRRRPGAWRIAQPLGQTPDASAASQRSRQRRSVLRQMPSAATLSSILSPPAPCSISRARSTTFCGVECAPTRRRRSSACSADDAMDGGFAGWYASFLDDPKSLCQSEARFDSHNSRCGDGFRADAAFPTRPVPKRGGTGTGCQALSPTAALLLLLLCAICAQPMARRCSRKANISPRCERPGAPDPEAHRT